MSKRRRNDVTPNFDETTIMDTLSKHDYVYRSLQAFAYMSDNPLTFIPNMPDSFYIQTTKGYIYTILNTFFSGCGLSYDRGEIVNEEKELQIVIYGPLNERGMNLNFSLFTKTIEHFIMDAFSNINHDWRSIMVRCEGPSLMFDVRIDLLQDRKERDTELYNYNKDSIDITEGPDKL